MIDLAQEFSTCDSQDSKKQEHLSKELYKAWDHSDFGMRIKEGIDLIERYLFPRMSPITIDSIKTWIKNTEQHHWKEMGEASDSQSLDWTCPKDIFKLDDFFIESIFNLGQEFFYKNELHIALSVLTVLVFLNPISPQAQLLLGLTFINLGRKEEAEQALGTALF